MAGHSKWKQIKHQKEAADVKKGRIFSKLANMISIAAKKDPNPQFNPTLRSAIERAKAANMPQENIERAMKRAEESEELEELTLEIYGPEGSVIIVQAVTDNRNRTVHEVKALLKEYDVKLGNPGSALWAFVKNGEEYAPKFPQVVSSSAKEKIKRLIEALEERDDVKEIYSNVQ